DFENAGRLQRPNALDRALYPLLHLGVGNGQTRIAAVPADGVEGRIRRRWSLAVSLLPHRLPLRYLFEPTFPHVVTISRANVRHDVGDETAVARSVLAGQDCRRADIGVPA